MKSLILLSLTTILLTLSACSSSSNNDEEGIVNPSGFTDLNQAEIVLTSIERALERKYDYDFIYESGLFSHILMPPVIPTDWVEEFEMRKQALVYASSLKALRDHEERLSAEDDSLYQELVNKTAAMASLIYQPTYNYAVTSINEIEVLSFEVEPVVLIDSLGLKLYTYTPARQNATDSVSVWKKSSKEMCLMLTVLNQFDLNFIGISRTGEYESCAFYPMVQFSAQYDEDLTVSENINNTNRFLLGHYNNFSTDMMNAAGIFLSSNSTANGYVASDRENYEEGVYYNNSHLETRTIDQALDNNLHENLYFKIEVLLRTQELFGLDESADAELYLAQMAIDSVNYNYISTRLGHSPFNYTSSDLEGAHPTVTSSSITDTPSSRDTRNRQLDFPTDDESSQTQGTGTGTRQLDFETLPTGVTQPRPTDITVETEQAEETVPAITRPATRPEIEVETLAPPTTIEVEEVTRQPAPRIETTTAVEQPAPRVETAETPEVEQQPTVEVETEGEIVIPQEVEDFFAD